jgi:hypothetical protein
MAKQESYLRLKIYQDLSINENNKYLSSNIANSIQNKPGKLKKKTAADEPCH